MEQPPKTIAQKLRENLAHLRARGASREELQGEINRAQSAMDRVSADERKLSGAETFAALGSKAAGGATFELFDEGAGLLGSDTGTQRFLQRQVEEEHPVLSAAASITGAIANPVRFLKAAPKAASLGAKALRVLGEGAAQGAASGLGAGEGGSADRAFSALKGGTAGAATAGAIGGVAKGLGAGSRRLGQTLGLTAPKIEEFAARVPDEDITSAQKKLSELKGRRLGDEAMVADLLPQGEGALRQAATSNRTVRKTVDTELRGRSNRLANTADDRFSEYTGTQPTSARKSVEELDAEASQRARPFYQASESEAGAAPKVERLTPQNRSELQGMGVTPPAGDAIDEALALPYVQTRIGELRKAPRSRFANAADDDHAMLDQVYKDIGRQIRSLDRKDWSLKEDLINQRAILADAITSRAPSYRQALSEFADPMGRKDAFLAGNKREPADVIPSNLAGLDKAETSAFKEGKAALLRQDVPNLEIGEMARFQDVLAPIATREKAGVFKATFGEQAYKDYVADLLEMAGLQRMKAGGGESTTTDKLLEQLQGDPDAIVGVVKSLLSGNPVSAITQSVPLKALDKLRNSKQGATNAEFLMRRGDSAERALEELLGMRTAAKATPSRPVPFGRNRQNARPDIQNTIARLAGATAGRP